ncbi:MAG: hypothetical protein EBS19_16465 [Spirochaetia bacterium]|nr:hypothetical protein [Spirochaetia bacterium]
MSAVLNDFKTLSISSSIRILPEFLNASIDSKALASKMVHIDIANPDFDNQWTSLFTTDVVDSAAIDVSSYNPFSNFSKPLFSEILEIQKESSLIIIS